MIKIHTSDTVKFVALPVLFASMCCLSPVILVVLGLSTVSFAASLGDTLYGTYKWVFRGVGLIALAVSYVLYVRRSVGVCTVDEALKRRNELINKAMIFIIAGVLGYVFFLYVVVHYVGVLLNIWK